MKKLLVTILLGVLSYSAVEANETQNDEAMFDQYTESSSLIQKSGWDFLGCTTSASRCKQIALRKGYSQYRLQGMSCNVHAPESQTCFAK